MGGAVARLIWEKGVRTTSIIFWRCFPKPLHNYLPNELLNLNLKFRAYGKNYNLKSCVFFFIHKYSVRFEEYQQPGSPLPIVRGSSGGGARFCSHDGDDFTKRATCQLLSNRLLLCNNRSSVPLTCTVHCSEGLATAAECWEIMSSA